ncbi:penicillin-binding protein 1A [Dongia deserti]|uniref:penicillin-binding protein 1A n=1 Tax=Dongia deserti TaxID=2268030 RepID=UPI000E647AD0|nr:penicillin-binding protein 1A [Dongia deserti]
MRLTRILSFLFGTLLFLGVVGAIAAWLVYEHFSQDLPDYYQLASYDPPVVSRIYAGDGRLLAEYAAENRVFVPISAMPKRVINAFLAAEDKTFYTHPGVDLPGVIAAVWTNIKNYGDRRPVGASTITQQVTKNFLLSNELSYKRKIREMILALRIEKAFTKNRILELYLNQIYLGAGNYGVATAALNYFNKSLDELTIGEAAYLAALPKAPNNYNIVRDHKAAVDRRNWVIERMREDGHITAEEAAAAKVEPLEQHRRAETEHVVADYFAEEVRREIVHRFGEAGLYKKGLAIRATIDPRLQEIADRVLRQHLVSYDKTQGYRGPLQHVDSADDWQKTLEALPPMPWLYDWQPAIVIEATKAVAKIGFKDGSTGEIQVADLGWAHPRSPDGRIGPSPTATTDVLKVGDIIAVEPLVEEGKVIEGRFALRQVPEISGALVAMDPHTGRVLAMTGGWSYQQSEFNRATQAKRQPGSSFKPLVYLSALEAGFTPSTMILDAPIVIDQGPGLPLWRPENYAQDFLGAATMRRGLENSRNLMTIRMAQTIGMARVAEMTARLGVIDNMQQTLAMSLGAGETTVLRLAGAYAEIVNGGKKIQPTLIDRVQDANGWTIYRHDGRPCDGCQMSSYNGEPPPEIPDMRQQVLDPATAYQMVSMLEGVVQRGTGTAVKVVGKPIAGKTGTTNESRDVWFMGFSPDLVAGVYLGFDQPRSLGAKATGGRYAAPIFRDFMIEALKDKPATPFRVPPGIRLVRVDYQSGQRAFPGADKVILEAFKPGTEPSGQQNVIQGIANYGQDAGYGSIIPLGTAGDTGQGGTTIIDSTGAYQQPSGAPNAASAGRPVITGEPTDDQPNLLPPGITPREEDEQVPAVQPPLQGPALGEAPPPPPVQPAPSAPATDSSGGIY